MTAPWPSPSFSTPHVTVYCGDALAVLREMPSESVDCCVTSPPYWGLRDYGTASWDGGDVACDHRQASTHVGPKTTLRRDGRKHEGLYESEKVASEGFPFRDTCGKCGATRIDSQLGLEPTPDAYVQNMVEVFREVRRVLRPAGTLWLNLGDSYAGGTQTGRNDEGPITNRAGGSVRGGPKVVIEKRDGLKPKDMVGIPWRVAFALQADGWYLRSDIIWAKPNPMPESVTDRPTKSHEYVFLMSKGPRYFYDAQAISESLSETSFVRLAQDVDSQQGSLRVPGKTNGPMRAVGGRRWPGIGPQHGAERDRGEKYEDMTVNATRNARTVWTIATQPYPEAHFATFPRELPERCIKAGTPESVCSTCGKARERITESVGDNVANEVIDSPTVPGLKPNTSHDRVRRLSGATYVHVRRQTGTLTDCGHNTYIPGTVLDPFAGSGTTLAVARDLGRRSIGIELNPEYVRLIERRCGQLALDLGA